MAASIFELVAEELERRTDLAKLEARGTVRLSLKQAGLDAHTVSARSSYSIRRARRPATALRNHNTLEDLDTLIATFRNPLMHAHRITRAQLWHIGVQLWL